jgi:hypothetical protein
MPSTSPVRDLQDASLLDDFAIRQEPRGQLFRYFIKAEQQLAERDVTVRRASFDDFIEIYDRHEDSFNGLTPVLDPRVAPIPDETAACFVGVDRHGDPVTTMAIRYVDLAGTPLKTAFEDLTFFYGQAASAWRERVACSIACPSATRIRSSVMWSGGFWVRPDRRHDGLASLMPDIGRYYGLSQWRPDCEISVGAPAFKSERVQRAYEFEHHEEGFSIRKDGALFFQGYLVWSSADHLKQRLGRLIDAGSGQMGRGQEEGVISDVVRN